MDICIQELFDVYSRNMLGKKTKNRYSRVSICIHALGSLNEYFSKESNT